jgi:hypothetical protein
MICSLIAVDGRTDDEDLVIGGGRRVVYGTDDGVYVSDLRDPNKDPARVLALLEVTQVDVLEDYQLLIVLSGAFWSHLRWEL